MKYFLQFLIIVAFVLLGEICGKIIPLSVAGTIYGLIFLFLALFFKFIKLEQIENISSFFLKIMPVLFVAPAVGIVDVWGDIKPIAIELVVIIISVFLIVMGLVGRASQFLINRKKND